MPRPKSKNPSRRNADNEDESEFGGLSGSEEENGKVMEKDEEEEELDKLVLGDGGGWMASLGMTMDVDGEGDEERSREGEKEGDGEEDEGLEGLDDADVSTSFISHNVLTDVYSSFSF